MDSIDGTKRIIGQMEELLSSLDVESYTRRLELLNGASLGQHVRHIYDFYECLMRHGSSGIIDYADRCRDLKIESDPDQARRALRQILFRLDKYETGLSLSVRGDFSTRPGDDRPLLRTSMGRELMYAYDHAIHHLAIIRIGLQHYFPQLAINRHLGVAPSTVKYRSAEKK